MNEGIRTKLNFLYGEDRGKDTAEKLEKLLDKWRKKVPPLPAVPEEGVSVDEGDAIMITYGDNIQEKGKTPLDALGEFAGQRLKDVISGIHILPFSPYSSDDGFSVMDYREVNPNLGLWEDLTRLSSSFRLMADLVLNHCSARGTWFQKFLQGEKPYDDFFITVEPGTDLSLVFRPRALPLLHEFEVEGEKKLVWTTFSGDQVDLNFGNPEVFLEFMDILLFYISQGVGIVRLDAVGFLWKEIGSTCMHHPKTHEMVKLFRLALAELVPGLILITETNVPHKENIAYFGQGRDEAHMVYQFPLPPLTLDAFIRGNASKLTAWARTLPPPVKDHTFFNFLASHDGVGVLPARGFLDSGELEALVAAVEDRGGLVSYKTTPDGDIPYELNVNYADAVAETSLDLESRAAKFLASQGVMLAMAGVPGIYIHSLLGSGNWKEGVEITGMNRTINREKLSRVDLEEELDREGSFRQKVFLGYSRLLSARKSRRAFHPAGGQTILDWGSGVFALERRDPQGGGEVLCLHSVAGDSQDLEIPGAWVSGGGAFLDLISGRTLKALGTAGGGFTLPLGPWEVLWLEKIQTSG